MARTNSSNSNAIFSRREGDWLLPYNRRLRNLNSISLRNLHVVTNAQSIPRRQTIDDDAVPHALQSPAKTVALREHKGLTHSRSSTDLRTVPQRHVTENEAESTTVANGSPPNHKAKSKVQVEHVSRPVRPEFKLTRRSTLEWVNATPQRRQDKLERVADEYLADVFFTLHHQDIQDPIYISETIGRTMNPTFRNIDWSACGPGITRAEEVVLRIWTHAGKNEDWRQLLDVKLHFQELRYLGKSIDNIEVRLPHNSVLFHLVDGVYTLPPESFSGSSSTTPVTLAKTSTNSSFRMLPTSSFDALLRLAKLDDSIQDALATREQLSGDLERLLQANREALVNRDRVVERQDRLATIEYAKKTVERQLDKARKQQSEKSASIDVRRKLMKSDSANRKNGEDEMVKNRPNFPSMRDEHEVKKKAVQNQRRRVCEDLQKLFPIQPQPGKALAFTIRGLHLPNSEDLDAEPFDIVSAALGHVSQVLLLISFYYSYPLPYPVNPRSSSSTIFDPISILKTNTPINSHNTEQSLRTYPLFSKGVPRFRFEYAVFLLNQDIRILLESIFNVRVLDVRQTLPNLKYLLYVATAGEGELPARKAGGVKGLLRGPLRRLGSSDSTSSTMSGLTLHGNGKPVDAVESLKRLGGGGDGK